jgi:FixJ family two-component response regulator/HPt (histidine-containing phosphotransfer) domain-containing protein
MSLLDLNELDEFIIESEELLQEAETDLLKVDNGEDFLRYYDAIFRVFHSLKGAAGMTGLEKLQDYMHKTESFFSTKKQTGLNKKELTFILKCIDNARLILRGDTSITFDQSEIQSPLKEDQKKQHSLKKKQISESSAGLIWVVDDESDLVEIYVEKFERAGFECAGFTDPQELLSKFELFKPDLIISDFKMPLMNGIQLLEKLRQKNSQLPFILCSGFLEKSMLMKAMELGAYAALDKPPDDTHTIFLATNAVAQYQSSKLISKLINFLLFQFSELEKALQQTGQLEQLETFRKDLKALLNQRSQINNTRKSVQI